MEYPFSKYSLGFLRLQANENPLGPSPLVKRILKKNLWRISLYPDPFYTSLRKEIGKNFSLLPDEIIVGNGSDEVLDIFLRFVMLKEKQNVSLITAEGVFAYYEISAQNLGIRVIKTKLKDFGYDLENMETLAKKNKPCIVALSNPINPTGKIIGYEEFKEFVGNLNIEGVYIVSDEAYFEFADYLQGKDWRPKIYRTSAKLQENIFTLRTFSKAYGLAGIRLGYGIGEKSLVQNLFKVKPPFNVNHLAELAGIYALRDKKHLKKTLETNYKFQREMEKILDGIDFIPSWANFISIKVNPKIVKKFEEEKILIRDLTPYGFDMVRISMFKPQKRILEKIKKLLYGFMV